MTNSPNRPVRILYLDHAPIWGGAEAVLVTLLQHLDREQFQPFVATAAQSPLAQRLAGSDVPLLPVPFDTLNQAGWRLPFHLARSVTAVARLIRQQAITLIHTNTVRAHIVGSLAGWLTRTPVSLDPARQHLPAPAGALAGAHPPASHRRLRLAGRTIRTSAA
jgi:hypothetical protein